MKTKNLFELLLLVTCTISLLSCQSDSHFQGSIEKIKVYVSAETDMYLPFEATTPMECMLVKEDKQDEYIKMDLSGITGFTYEKGYEYNLLIEKRAFPTPSADKSNITYKLLRVLSKEEAIGKKRIIDFFVSAETGYYKCGDITEDIPQEGMRVREDENADWRTVPFNMIINFDYEKGYSYKLLIEETILDNPTTIGHDKIYRLIEVLSKELLPK